MTPCVVIIRDRAAFTRLSVASLEQFPDLDIHLVDHGTTYGPMLDYFDGSPHPVHRLGDRPPRALWDWDGLARIVGTRREYVVTDPDLTFDDNCPADWLTQLREHLACNPTSTAKVGMGLRLDDLPNTPLAEKVRAWECLFWTARGIGHTWRAPVDTTLALYPPLHGQPAFVLAPAVRMDAPYLMRHLPWYDDPAPEETVYYRDHALEGTSHWINGGW
jgi:hypothetical protein